MTTTLAGELYLYRSVHIMLHFDLWHNVCLFVCVCLCVCVCRHGGRSITPPPMLESILSLEELLSKYY